MPAGAAPGSPSIWPPPASMRQPTGPAFQTAPACGEFPSGNVADGGTPTGAAALRPHLTSGQIGRKPEVSLRRAAARRCWRAARGGRASPPRPCRRRARRSPRRSPCAHCRRCAPARLRSSVTTRCSVSQSEIWSCSAMKIGLRAILASSKWKAMSVAVNCVAVADRLPVGVERPLQRCEIFLRRGLCRLARQPDLEEQARALEMPVAVRRRQHLPHRRRHAGEDVARRRHQHARPRAVGEFHQPGLLQARSAPRGSPGRPTPNVVCRSRSGGSWSPGRSLPARICASRWAATCSKSFLRSMTIGSTIDLSYHHA